MESPTLTSELVRPSSHRLRWLDAQRGFIMMLMAVDHSAALIARSHASEFWGIPMHVYKDVLSFLTRFMTHICAPGFFLLMGMGIFFLEKSRRNKNWSEWRISKHLLMRGGILLIVQHIIENPAWMLGLGAASSDLPSGPPPPGVLGPPIGVFGVLTALGLSMMVLAFLRHLPWWLNLILAVGVMIASQLAIPGEEAIQIGYSLPIRLLIIPGMTAPFLVMYPLLPWLGVALIGFVYGQWLQQKPNQSARYALPLGLGLIGVFFLIRILSDFGNHHPYENGDWMAFMNVAKYPPSLAYLSWTLGVNFILMFIFHHQNVQQDSNHYS